MRKLHRLCFVFACVFACVMTGCVDSEHVDFSMIRQYLTGQVQCLFLADEIVRGGIGVDEIDVLDACLEETRDAWKVHAVAEEVVDLFKALAQLKDELVLHPWQGCGDSADMMLTLSADGAYRLMRRRADGGVITEDEGTWKLSLGMHDNFLIQLYHQDDVYGWSMNIRMLTDRLEISEGSEDGTHLTFAR